METIKESSRRVGCSENVAMFWAKQGRISGAKRIKYEKQRRWRFEEDSWPDLATFTTKIPKYLREKCPSRRSRRYTLIGGAGSDGLRGGGEDDTVIGDPSNDTLFGNNGLDTIRGGGNDRLFGGAGGASLFGDIGNDRLSGQDGAD